jgi:transcription termination factor NusB
MEETGGSVEDYVRLNADYSNIDDNTLLREYYKKEKPYLDNSDIDLLLEDFQYDEDLDEDRDIRKKKLAFKEEVAKAKNFLESTKEKYYADIKLKSNVNPDAQKAMDFFNRYNKQQEQAEENRKVFQENTKNLFTNDFEGFDISVGQKKYRYKIQNADGVADKQSDINNLIGKFLDKNGSVSDYKGYHKAMYAAENVDRIAAHFYEQGKADAVKGVIDNSKNLSDKTARPSSNGDVFLNGFKVKAISGADSTKLKVKTKKFN